MLLVDAPFIGDQASFHASLAPIRGCFCGNRAGKTFCGCREAVWSSTGLHPFRDVPVPNIGWVGAESFSFACQVIVPEILRLAPPRSVRKDASRDDKDPRIEWKNGSLIRFRSYDQNREKYQGAKIHWLWWDEEPPEELRTEGSMRLIDYGGFEFFTMTPVKGQTWVYDNVWLPWEDGTDRSIACFSWSTEENTEIDQGAVDLRMGKLTKDEQLIRRHGIFTSSKGLVWAKHFDHATHVIDPRPIPRHHRHYLIMDPGHSHHFGAAGFTVDEHGAVEFWGEYLRDRELIRDHVRGIVDLYRDHHPHLVNEKLYRKNLLSGLVPEASSDVMLQGVQSVMDPAAAQYRREFCQYGIKPKPASKDVDVGLQRGGEWLQAWSPDGQRMVRFHRGRAGKLVKQVLRLAWANPTNRQGEYVREKVKKYKDDLADCYRYGVMERPPLAQTPKADRPPGSFDEAMAELEEVRRSSKRMGNERFTTEQLVRQLEMQRGW